MSRERALAGPARHTAVIAAQHAATRSSLLGVLSREAGYAAVAATDLRRAVRLLRMSAPDAILVDRAILGDAGLRRLPMLAALAPQAALLVVGMGEHAGYDRAARDAGGHGYLRLDLPPEHLAAAVAGAVSARDH